MKKTDRMTHNDNQAQPNEPTLYTRVANNKLAQTLNFEDRQAFDDANRGFLGGDHHDNIQNDAGRPIWRWSEYRTFLDSNPDTPAPKSVNPSLWRQSQLTMITGLFQVTDHIYQVRNYDLSNITFIESDRSIIVVDVLSCKETAKAAINLFYEKRYTGSNEPIKKVEWVIYTHSHTDHYGGIRGILEHEHASEDMQIVAPEGFLEEVLSENVMAGNVMSRRAAYMYGVLLPRNVKGQVGIGLGMAMPNLGSTGLVEPTMTITKADNFQTKSIGGLDFEFQFVPDSEAPAEMHFYIPKFKALCTAENATQNLHNIYTLRGAKVRNSKLWSDYLSETIQQWGDQAEVLFGVHHWPVWKDGENRIVNYLKKQRNIYKYIHDQTLRLANHGHNMDEIAEMIVAEGLPNALHINWATRDYYGTLSHNVKGVYVYYLGWYDGNPATLHPLPRIEASQNYVAYMGGADTLLSKAEADYKLGRYRWVAQVVNHLVYADPTNQRARKLQANALEQLGYQAESGPWRNFYLSAAQNLRGLEPSINASGSANPDTISGMPISTLFDYMAIRLNGFEAKKIEQPINFRWNFTDIGEQYLMTLENCVLSHVKIISLSDNQAIDSHITLARQTLNDIILGNTTVEDAIASGDLQITGDWQKLEDLFSLMDRFELFFNLVTPVSR